MSEHEGEAGQEVVPPVKEPPTVPPGEPPTVPPSEPPAVPPSEPPTVPPGEPPTVPPSEPPTEPPEVPPSAPPNLPPSEPPTEPPLEPPTEPPLEPPWEPPSEPPSEPPYEPPSEPPGGPPIEPPVGDTRIGAIAVAIITMSVGVAAFLVASIAGSLINLVFSAILGQLSLLAVTVVVLRLSRRSVTRFTGLAGSRPRAFAAGALIGVGNAFLISGPLQLLNKHLFPEWLLKMFDMAELLSRIEFLPLESWGMALAAVVMAPIIEELLFRGLFFRALAQWHPGWAAVISAAIFSAYHLDPVGFLARFEIGLVLAWLFWRTRSLGACIAAHGANNLLATAGFAAMKAGNGVDPTEPRSLWGWLFAVALGLVLVVPAVLALWRSQPSAWARPADDEATPRRSFFAETLPWVTGAILSIGLMVRFDRLGAQLSMVDLTTPLKAATTEQQKHEREVLKRLRTSARAGTIPVASYVELRRELAKRGKE